MYLALSFQLHTKYYFLNKPKIVKPETSIYRSIWTSLERRVNVSNNLSLASLVNYITRWTLDNCGKLEIRTQVNRMSSFIKSRVKANSTWIHLWSDSGSTRSFGSSLYKIPNIYSHYKYNSHGRWIVTCYAFFDGKALDNLVGNRGIVLVCDFAFKVKAIPGNGALNLICRNQIPYNPLRLFHISSPLPIWTARFTILPVAFKLVSC